MTENIGTGLKEAQSTSTCFTKGKKKKEKEVCFPSGLWLDEKKSLSIGSIVSFQETQKIMINKGITIYELCFS